jgi:predicted nucleic acid-binding protein
MKDKAFIDTNVLVYLYSEDEVEKQLCAYNAIKTFDCYVSTQTLNEFSNVCLKKLHASTEFIAKSIDEIASTCIVTLITYEVIRKALTIHCKYGYSYYDCLMISSALFSGCKYLLSEDFKNQHLIENSLTVVNIFPLKNNNESC